MVDEAGRGGAGGAVEDEDEDEDEEGPVGAALGDGGVGVVVDGEQDEAAGGETERVGDGVRVGQVGEEVEVVAVEAGGEVGEVEGDDAVVDEAGPAEDGEVGADELHVAVAEHPLLSGAGAGAHHGGRGADWWDGVS